MTKGQLVELFSTLNTLGKLQGVKFTYAVARNIAALKNEVEAINKSLEPSSEFMVYDKERVELAQKFAKKDEKDKPLTENNRYVMEDEKGFDKAFAKLQEKHKEIIEKREKQFKDYIELLAEEAGNIELYKVKLEHVPEPITALQMNGILPIIDES